MNAKDIIKQLKHGYGDVVVYPWSHNRVKTYIFSNGQRLSENEFEWHLDKNPKQATREKDTPYYLSLADISAQWFRRHKDTVLTVVVETEFDGNIYQAGIDGNTVWRKHGITEGYGERKDKQETL
jgi:hypothetical protein